MNKNESFNIGGLSLTMQYFSDKINKASVDELLNNYGYLETSGRLLAPTTYILDYELKKFIAISGNVMNLIGYSPSYLLDNGYDSFLELLVKEDMLTIVEKIRPYDVNFLKSIPHEEHGKYIFSQNYRIKTASDTIVTLFQQNTLILSPETGLPHYNIGIVSDISHLKNDTSILHKIEKMINHDNIHEKVMIYSTTFYPSSELLTSREVEILKLIAEGMNSKAIAKKLFLSDSTVINHRKNMISKSSSKNVAQMISYGIRNKII